MSYQVFARKYRPKTFDDVLGQDHVVRTLTNAIREDRLHHAYLFVGPRGTGKTSTARILAKALNCPGGPKVDFDPDDPVCQEIADGRSLDVLEIDGASNNGVEQVRELRENVKFAPVAGKFRIYYIDEVHMLSQAAFNALLKTLEEPPPHAKFIFATTEAQKVLPTIISRCQRFDLRRIPDATIASHLLHIAANESVELDPTAAAAIARGADGGMRDAQSMLDQLVAFCGTTITEKEVLDIFGFTSHETLTSLAGSLVGRDAPRALEVLNEQNESGKDLSKLLADLIGFFRTLLIEKVAPGTESGPGAGGSGGALAESVGALAPKIQTDRLLNLIDGLAAADAAMRWNPNKKLHFEIAIVKAIQTLSETTISDVVTALESGGAALTTAAGAAAATPAPAKPKTRTPRPSQPAQDTTQHPAPAPAPAQELKPNATGTTTDADPARAMPEPEPERSALADAADPATVWATVVERFQTKLMGPWLSAGVFTGKSGRVYTVAFHPEDAHKRDQIDRPSARNKVLEMLREVTGANADVRFEVSDDVARPRPPTPDDEPDDGPGTGAGEGGAAAGGGDATPGGTPPSQAAGDTGTAPAPATSDGQRDDPLIKDALEVFEASRK